MAAVIRFNRAGTKKKPHYRIVVQDRRKARDGGFVENLGSFDPKKDGSIVVNRPRFEYWLKTGAQVSTSVSNRLKRLLKEWKQTGKPEAELRP